MWRSEICCYRMTFGYVLGEIVELLDEVRKGDWSGMWSELLDVYSCGVVWLSDVSGLDLWVVKNKSIVGWQRRWDWWELYLAYNDLEFKDHYMKYGSNYDRLEKRERVARMALTEQRPNVDFGGIDGGYWFSNAGEIVGLDEY